MTYSGVIVLVALGVVCGCKSGLQYQRTEADILSYTLTPEHSRGNLVIDTIIPTIKEIRVEDGWLQIADIELEIHGMFSKAKGYYDENQYIESVVVVLEDASKYMDKPWKNRRYIARLYITDLYNNFNHKVKGEYEITTEGKRFTFRVTVPIDYQKGRTQVVFMCKDTETEFEWLRPE